ncbi:hypothetical protein [Burkholderia sp. LMU1-1-1.1]|uniref:hypothetical protein n=1 Tax=Burkholderia sp. LMU1-1-1.1 TaxID=3135266 RepID=UPI0034177209
MNVNTSIDTAQAKNATLPLLQLGSLQAHVSSVEEQALTAQTLAEIAFEIIDGMNITDPATLQAATRLDALFKSAYRAAILIQESAAAISLALEEVEGGAQ